MSRHYPTTPTPPAGPCYLCERKSLFVYFAQLGHDGPVKVGSTRDISKRICQLQTAQPEQIRLVGWVEGACCAVADDGVTRVNRERFFHGQLEGSRLQGEWFRPSDHLGWILQEVA